MRECRCARSTPTAASAPAPATPRSPATGSVTRSSRASNAPHRSSTAATGNAATATATDWKDASRNSNARAYTGRGYVASKAPRPGSAASPSPTTCNGWRSSADRGEQRAPTRSNRRQSQPKLGRLTLFQGEVETSGDAAAAHNGDCRRAGTPDARERRLSGPALPATLTAADLHAEHDP